QRLHRVQAEAPGGVSLEDIGVEGIEAAGLGEDDPATLRSIRVDIGKRHKIGWESGAAIHSYAVLRLGPRGAGDQERDGQGRGAAHPHENLRSHFRNNPFPPCFTGPTLSPHPCLFKLLAWPSAKDRV